MCSDDTHDNGMIFNSSLRQIHELSSETVSAFGCSRTVSLGRTLLINQARRMISKSVEFMYNLLEIDRVGCALGVDEQYPAA